MQKRKVLISFPIWCIRVILSPKRRKEKKKQNENLEQT